MKFCLDLTLMHCGGSLYLEPAEVVALVSKTDVRADKYGDPECRQYTTVVTRHCGSFDVVQDSGFIRSWVMQLLDGKGALPDNLGPQPEYELTELHDDKEPVDDRDQT